MKNDDDDMMKNYHVLIYLYFKCHPIPSSRSTQFRSTKFNKLSHIFYYCDIQYKTSLLKLRNNILLISRHNKDNVEVKQIQPWRPWIEPAHVWKIAKHCQTLKG